MTLDELSGCLTFLLLPAIAIWVGVHYELDAEIVALIAVASAVLGFPLGAGVIGPAALYFEYFATRPTARVKSLYDTELLYGAEFRSNCRKLSRLKYLDGYLIWVEPWGELWLSKSPYDDLQIDTKRRVLTDGKLILHNGGPVRKRSLNKLGIEFSEFSYRE